MLRIVDSLSDARGYWTQTTRAGWSWHSLSLHKEMASCVGEIETSAIGADQKRWLAAFASCAMTRCSDER